MRCPACGLELPNYARFCARCGTPQHAPAAPPPPAGPGRLAPGWLIAVFWAGAALSLLITAAYAAIAVSPALAGLAGDPGRVRASALVIAVWSAALFGAQSVAATGLLRRREWAMVPATLACVGWALTCIGLPVAVFVLAALWSRKPGGPVRGR